jgi:hypothetical protein
VILPAVDECCPAIGLARVHSDAPMKDGNPLAVQTPRANLREDVLV